MEIFDERKAILKLIFSNQNGVTKENIVEYLDYVNKIRYTDNEVDLFLMELKDQNKVKNKDGFWFPYSQWFESHNPAPPDMQKGWQWLVREVSGIPAALNNIVVNQEELRAFMLYKFQQLIEFFIGNILFIGFVVNSE